VDAAQIEARIVAWICGEHELVQQFRGGEDVYASFASHVFGYPVGKKSHPKERFMGKTAILGLGYQVGATKFQSTIEVQSQLQLGTKIVLSEAEAKDIVELYRTKYRGIPDAWTELQNNGIRTLSGRHNGHEFGPCVFERGAIRLPNGLRLHYHNLHYESPLETGAGGHWMFEHGGAPKMLYGGKMLENIVQALARIITMDAALRIQKKYKLGMQVHDELVYSVPLGDVGSVRELLLEEMSRAPTWAPDLPLAAEVGVGLSYGDAK
jgi:DNA polymerase